MPSRGASWAGNGGVRLPKGEGANSLQGRREPSPGRDGPGKQESRAPGKMRGSRSGKGAGAVSCSDELSQQRA